jgi:transcriptional regulator with XRE-family HTH domain
MPAHVDVNPSELQLLQTLGQRVRERRLVWKLPVQELALALKVSRTTIYAVERGDPSVTIGTFLRVMARLDLASDLWLAGTGVGRTLQVAAAAAAAPAHAGDLHQRQDERSLALHEEAVKVLRREPERAQKALQVLQKWETLADPHSKPLRDEWRRIITRKLWDVAAERSERGAQLRQASPLGFVLEPEVRQEILRRYSRAAQRE